MDEEAGLPPEAGAGWAALAGDIVARSFARIFLSIVRS